MVDKGCSLEVIYLDLFKLWNVLTLTSEDLTCVALFFVLGPLKYMWICAIKAKLPMVLTAKYTSYYVLIYVYMTVCDQGWEWYVWC